MGHEMIRKTLVHAALAVVLAASAAVAQARKLNVADPMPQITATDSSGTEFKYPRDANEVLLVAFLSPAKSQSVKALADLEQMVEAIDQSPNGLSVLYVLEDDPNSAAAIKIQEQGPNARIQKRLVVDQGYQLWGTFGVIASPTVFLAGTDQKIRYIKAGYGYDFAPAIKSKLQVALGLTRQDTFTESGGIKTVNNDTISGKVSRHLQMAKMLQQQQKYDSALKQLELAARIDPNSTDTLLELGRLYCLVSEPQKAIDTITPIETSQKEQQAIRTFLLGKGHYLLKEYEMAEKCLLESLELDPLSSEAYYLLGRVYHVQNQTEKAVQAYYESLRLLYGQTE